MDYSIQFFLKFGSNKNLERLLKEGMFYAAPIKEFKKDSSHDRFDLNEGLNELKHLNQEYKIQIKAPEWIDWKELPITKGVFNKWINDSGNHNYSLFSISEQEARLQEYYPIPEKMKDFGDSYLLIHNPSEFMRRVENSLNELNFEFTYGLIDYYDPNINHKGLGFFHKSEKHSYEKEFRILIKNPSDSPTIIFLGNLEEIASLHKIDEFTGFKFIWPK